MKGIKDWPIDDRPQEKLLRHGEDALSNAELLAILLRTGSPGVSAVELARRILNRFGGFRGLAHTDRCQWKEFKGIGPTKRAQIKAVLEIARRFNCEMVEQRTRVTTAQDAVNLVLPALRDLKTETFRVIFLNAQNEILQVAMMANGTVNHAYPIVREIVHEALQQFSSALICVHNHPSGNPQPSPQDERFTRDLKQACALMNLSLLDHLIIGDNSFFSFAESGRLG